MFAQLEYDELGRVTRWDYDDALSAIPGHGAQVEVVV
jgi:hypothetical protein